MRATLACFVLLCACSKPKPAVWSEVPLEGGSGVRIDELAATPLGELWAVSRPDVYRLDEQRWVKTGAPGAEHIAALSSTDVWGVGRGGSWFHFDGKEWSSGRAEPVASLYLDFLGVLAWPATDARKEEVWATAGVEGFFRFDGKEWAPLQPPELQGWQLERVSAVGKDIFVALSRGRGEVGRRTYQSQLGHWNGKDWEFIDQPSGLRVRGSAADDVWIVRKTPMHFDGTGWTATTLPDDDAVAYDLFARSKTEAYLVGAKGLAMKWDGAAWSELPTGTRDDLFCVIGASKGPVWAGGARGKMLRFPK